MRVHRPQGTAMQTRSALPSARAFFRFCVTSPGSMVAAPCIADRVN
jgi:hypothetical protein